MAEDSSETSAAELKTRTVRGGAITVVAQGAKFALQTTTTVVLARLLSPEDFGLTAMVGAFTGFISIFRDMGLSSATVQRDQISDEQVSTLFWINVLVSAVLMVIGAALAPFVTWFYGRPELFWVMVAVSATFIFGGLSAQHSALLQRQMRLGAIATCDIIAMVAGFVTAVALQSTGYWALVAMGAVQGVLSTAGLWVLSGWVPSRPRRGTGILPMLKFGGSLTGFNLFHYFSRNLDGVLIGWSAGAAAVGLYSRAYGLLMLPMRQINIPLQAVAMPVLSRLQNDPDRYRSYYCRALNFIAYVTAPMIALLAAASAPIIHVLLGPKWHEASDIFCYLAIAAMFQPILWTGAWVLMSLGRPQRLLYMAFFNDPMQVASFFIGLPWGARGVALSYAVCINLLTPPTLYIALKDSPVSMRDLMRAIWRPYCFSALLALAAFAIVHEASGYSPVVVCCFVAAGCVLVTAGTLVTWKGARDEIMALVDLAKHLRGPRPAPAVVPADIAVAG